MSIKKSTFADKAINYFCSLKAPAKLLPGVKVMNPYDSKETKKIIKDFYTKFFNDKNKRTFIFGINPGRFGGGVTGVAFTDPIALEEKLGIANSIAKKTELSSRFVYKIIDEYGDTKKFYSKFFISALYPLALIKDGKNYNYYDSKKLWRLLKPQIISEFKKQIEFGAKRDSIICLGRKNAVYLKEINDESGFFKEIKILDHPRYIMQYKQRDIKEYIKEYLDALK